MPSWWPIAVSAVAAFLAIRTLVRLMRAHERVTRRRLRREHMERLARERAAVPPAEVA